MGMRMQVGRSGPGAAVDPGQATSDRRVGKPLLTVIGCSREDPCRHKKLDLWALVVLSEEQAALLGLHQILPNDCALITTCLLPFSRCRCARWR